MRRVANAPLLFPLLAALLAAAGASAEPCRLDLSAADANYGYRHRAPPDRCEGLYSQPVAGEGLELLSFIAGPAPSDPGGGRPLTITTPDLRGLGTPKVTVVARSLPLRIYYRMDASVPSGGSLAWPVGEVVVAAGLDPAWIGLAGSVQTREGTIYVPLSVGTGPDAAAAGTPSVMVFRTTLDLDSFQWRLYGPGGPAPAWNRIGHPVRAGDPVSITLDPPAGKVMTLDIAARPVGQDYIQSRFKIFQP
jgi:hypothetical protein